MVMMHPTYLSGPKTMSTYSDIKQFWERHFVVFFMLILRSLVHPLPGWPGSAGICHVQSNYIPMWPVAAVWTAQLSFCF